MTDIRWKQRFDNYVAALKHLSSAMQLAEQRPLSELEQQGVIQNFEICYELTWKVMQDYLKDQGGYEGGGSKDVLRLALNRELISDGQIWMDMVKERNKTSQTYSSEILGNLMDKIQHQFHPAFKAMEQKFNKLYQQT